MKTLGKSLRKSRLSSNRLTDKIGQPPEDDYLPFVTNSLGDDEIMKIEPKDKSIQPVKKSELTGDPDMLRKFLLSMRNMPKKF